MPLSKGSQFCSVRIFDSPSSLVKNKMYPREVYRTPWSQDPFVSKLLLFSRFKTRDSLKRVWGSGTLNETSSNNKFQTGKLLFNNWRLSEEGKNDEKPQNCPFTGSGFLGRRGPTTSGESITSDTTQRLSRRVPSIVKLGLWTVVRKRDMKTYSGYTH